MAITTEFKVEDDAFYIEGVEKGVEKANRQVIEDLVNKFGFSNEQAAQATRSSIAFVLKVRQEMAGRMDQN